MDRDGKQVNGQSVGAIASLVEMPARKSMGEHVFENLKQAIIRGDIPPGERLVESRLADMLNISRTPVREAIHKLEREGFLEKLPKGGFSVPGLTRRDIEETFGIRGALESYAARLAAEKHTESDLDALEQKIEEYRECLATDEVDELARINTEFHDLLYSLSRSPRLVKMINDLRDQIYRFRQMILKQEAMAKASNEDHLQMLEYIRKRDGDGVERIVREHIIRGRDAVLKGLEKETC